MSSAFHHQPYGLASGLVLDERPPAPCRACPRCRARLSGGPAVFWCRNGHHLHGGDLVAEVTR